MQKVFAYRIANAVLLLCLAVAIGRASSIVDLTGAAIDPLKETHGSPVVLIFLRTDCPISNRYAPVLQELAQKYSPKVKFWLVYPGEVQTPASIHQQMTDYGYHIAALRDLRHQLVDLCGVKVTPEAAVFNPSGKLIYHGRIDNRYESLARVRSAATTHELADAIEAALQGRAPANPAVPGIGCSVADLE
jgi:hypothetical protein